MSATIFDFTAAQKAKRNHQSVKAVEFIESDRSEGWVDGLLQGRKGVCVYVELGQEREYTTSSRIR